MEGFSKKCSGVLYLHCILLYSSIGFAEIHGSATATSNYVWRGYSKSDGDFAFQVNLDYEHSSGFYVGTSASTVDFGDRGFSDRAQFEITPYLGWTFSLSDEWRMDLQWTRYLYDGKIFGEDSDYNEFYGLLHYRDLFTARVSFSENFYNRNHAAADFELTGRYPLTDWLEFSSGVGYSLTKDSIEYDYLYWNAGLSAYYKFVVLDFRYMDAHHTRQEVLDDHLDSEDQYPEAIDATFVFTITVGF